MAAMLCELESGDEVIMPSYAFASAPNAVVLRGARPVFVDIRRDTLNLDESQIEAAITPRTKALIVIHYAGFACEMDVIMDIARRHGLMVIEDAAQALMSRYRDRPLGSIGHFAAFSFHETKNFISGEGGALIINDSRFIRRAEIIWEKGTNRASFFRGEVDKYTWVDIGSSYLPSDIIAAFLFAQLEVADSLLARRRALWKRYREGCAELEAAGLVCLPREADHCIHNAHLFYLVLPDPSVQMALTAWLKDAGIQAPFHYVPLHSAPAGLRFGRVHGSMAVTDDIAGRLIRLPLWHDMTREPDIVMNSIREFLRSGRAALNWLASDARRS
jgi:dTDP-4-amino-4,6-dideoxygalactose transaminase